MDRIFEHQGTTFMWNVEKAAENSRRHGIKFTEAATVFSDPEFVVTDAARNGEVRHKAIGFSRAGKLLAVVHLEVDGEFIRIISAWPATAAETQLYD